MNDQRHTILIAERNPHVRDFIGRELAGSNLLVSCASNSDEIFKALDSQEPPDLVILSEDTPNTGGQGLLERISATHPHVPVVLHIYHEEPQEPDSRSLAAGIVEKNANPEELMRTIRGILNSLPVRRPGSQRRGA